MLVWIKNAPTPAQIRDQIINVESAFSQAMITYAESCHQGGFSGGDRDTVTQKLEDNKKEATYIDPTYSIPVIPVEEYCRCEEAGCEKCIATSSWRMRFIDESDDVLLRTNLHTCNPKYCRSNKYGVCKARMPRQVRSESKIDPETGATRFKHMEAWMNDVCVLISYLLRSNHDCTSLLSGSAVNHIVYYITEYITKMGPQTHVIFDVIKSVFDKSSDLTAGSMEEKAAAQKLMTRLVNKLATKMELGSPMIAAYLLGNGDHYSSHKFKPFFWTPYYESVRSCWLDAAEPQSSDNVLIMKSHGKIIGVSEAQNYIYRGRELEGMKLYDFAKRCSRMTLNTAERSTGKRGKTDTSAAQTARTSATNLYLDDDTYIASDGGEDVEDNGVHQFGIPPVRALKTNHFAFLKGHSMASTHCMKLSPVNPDLVLNFMRTLPRGDVPNRDEYIMVMLMLFKPWRTGSDLKSKEETWEDAFDSHPFTAEERLLMLFFNLKWECLDGRDDFRMQLLAGKEPTFLLPFTAKEAADIDNENVAQDALENVTSPLDEYEAEGVNENEYYKSSRVAFEEMQTRMMKDDWHVGGYAKDLPPTARVTINKPVSKWSADVFDARAKALATMSGSGVEKRVDLSNGAPISGVAIVNKKMLTRRYVPPECPLLIDDIVCRHGLNEDQERAVRIVGNY
ncbi:hypothetical protein BD626DRAFT_371890, partial [Schizophyllum amplum]